MGKTTSIVQCFIFINVSGKKIEKKNDFFWHFHVDFARQAYTIA